MKSVGEIIKEYRKRKGMTQTELGERLFVSKQAVSKWERDTTLPDIDAIRKICDILSIPGEVILQRIINDPRAGKEAIQTLKGEKRISNQKQIERWRDYKFGMFIHYGVYSVIARINEWVMYHEPIDRDDYAKIAAEQFTADKFDADYYADLAKRAGMKYMVFTTRHHDGFALFDSKCSHKDFTVMNTPCKRDLVKEYADACRNAGLAVGFYYSPLDWRFEGYFFPRMYRKSADAMREQCFAQVRELMENYGKIDILWFDGGEDDWLGRGLNLNAWNISYDNEDSAYKNVMIPEFWGEYEMHDMVRSRQPHIVVNNRFGMRRLGDYTTPEGIVGNFDSEHPWETCYTIFNDATWGWIPNKNIMSLKEIIYVLIEVVTGGGNLLFNIPPRGDGSLDPTHEARLLEVGEWMEKYGDTIYGTRCGPFKNFKDIGGFNYRENRLYAFVKEDASPKLCLPLCGAEVTEVIARSGEDIKYSVKDGKLTLEFSGKRAPIMSVIEIVLNKSVGEVYKDLDLNTRVYF